MGRSKIEIKRIELVERTVAFAERWAGFLNKAREICVLCDVPVGLVIFSSADMLYGFWTPKTTYVLHTVFGTTGRGRE